MKRLQSLAAALALLLVVAGSAAAENVVRFTSSSGGAVAMDPHSRWVNADRAATQQVYEGLLDIDSNLAVVPQLALAWKLLDPTTWEFELRPDVRFHDGTPFTAADVLFSIERARAETSDLQGTPMTNIVAVEAVDERTVRFTTAAPDPLLWMRLASVAIMSRPWAEAHDVRVPTNVTAGEETFATRHANGTGPFVLESFEPYGRWVLVRNPEWWGKAEYPHNIDRIVHTQKNDAENLSALLRGELDLLQAPQYLDINRIRRNPDLKLVYRPKLFTAFFGFDQVSRELRTSNVRSRNPFQDKRVRQAVAHAVDFEAVLRPLMGELMLPAGMMVAPGANGYSPDLDRPTPYDPERAKALLAEAGYPNGFSMTLDCPSDWGDDETTTCEGAVEQLRAVGIETSISFLSNDQVYSRVEQEHESDFFLDSWTLDPDSEGLLRDLFHSQSRYNMAGYANPRVDELIDKIESEMVTYARDAYLEEAWRIVTEDLVYLPVRYGVSVWAVRKTLDIPPDPFDVPRFRLARLDPAKSN
jgi:peptide/nickel transport system substrate-binding protein